MGDRRHRRAKFRSGMSAFETIRAQAPRKPFDADRLLTAVCVGVPFLGLILFFAYPMLIVFLRSITVGRQLWDG